MSRIRHLLLALTTTLAAGAIAMPALAGGPDDERPIVDGDKPSFPMSGDAFEAQVEQRIERALAKLEAILAKQKLPAVVADAIRAEAGRLADTIRAAAAEAAADGTVTKEEADHVRELAMRLLREAREKYRPLLPKPGKREGKRGGQRHERRAGSE